MLNRVGDSPYSSSSLHHPTCGTLWWQRHAQQNYWKTFPDNSMTNRTSVDLKTTCHAAVTMHVAAIALTRSVVASIRLCCAQPCQCVLSQPVANSHSRSVALNRPTFEQRWQWGRFRATPSIVFFFCRFYVRPSSRYSLVHILLTSSAKSAPNRPFLDKFYLKSSSRYSLVHVLPSSSSKSAPRTSLSFRFWIAKRALATVCHSPVHFNFCRSTREPEKDTGFRARECCHPWHHAFPHCYSPHVNDYDIMLAWT